MNPFGAPHQIITSVWVPIFPKWGSFSIPAFHGLFSASGGILLIMKYLYVEFDYQLEEMMYFYASITVIMHIQTLFFTPITVVPRNAALENYSAFHHVSSTHCYDSYSISHTIWVIQYESYWLLFRVLLVNCFAVVNPGWTNTRIHVYLLMHRLNSENFWIFYQDEFNSNLNF